ncbi:MAG TPA: DUF342 domain-containing protein [Firmicutes bacterium]|jgi:uncharacterized protein (DUF342 family)|nr:DUF342 domain-containing protein [Bacillota bacterium]
MAEGEKKALVKIELTPDNMRAFLEIDLPEPDAAWPTYEEVLEAVKNAGVTYGLKEMVIRRVVEEKVVSPVLIAEGKPAVRGEDASVKYLFETERMKLIPKEMEDGRVNHRELSLIQNVRKGQVLVERQPPTQGIPGKNVKGEELKAVAGKDVFLVAGKNAYWDDDKKERLIAAIDGEPSLVGRKVSVLNVHHVPGNVGYATGNIDFAGSVVVRGDVENGFVVRAEGDVTVGGNVEGGSIYAGGNVTIRGGIAGQDKTVIECKGNLYTRYIDHAKIDVEGEIRGRDAILHSQVNAGQKITLESRKGMVMGGVVRARDEIHVQVLGSRMGTATEVEVGTSPTTRKELIELEKKITAMEKEFDKVEKALVILNKQGYDLTPEREELKARLTRTSFYLKAELKKHTTRRDELNEEISGPRAEKGRIKVRQRIYPGVKVIIGNAVRIFKDEVHFAVLTYDDGEVAVQAYR